MADVSALYPQAPAPGPLSDPTKVLELLPVLSQMAVGQEYQKALNSDGTLDYNALATGIKSNPAARFAAPAATSTMLAQHGQEIANSTAAFGLASSQNKFLIDGIGALAAKPDVNDGDIHNFVVTAARNTGIPSPILTGWMNSLPKNDPVALHKALIAFQNMSMGASAASTPTPLGVTAAGAPITGTRGQFNYAAQGGQQPQGAQPPPQQNGAGSGIVTGLSPGAAGAQTATGTQSGQQLAADRTAAGNYRREVFPLEQAIPALEKLGTTGTGPAKDQINQIKSFLQSSGAGTLLGIDPSSIKNFDEAKKYLTDWVMATGSSGTNDKLAAAFASNANVNISNAAAVDVAKAALSLRRMKQAQTIEFARTGLPPEEYANWASTWNVSQDPRAYGVEMMGAEQKKRLFAELNKKGNEAEKARFVASLRIADHNKLTSPRAGWTSE